MMSNMIFPWSPSCHQALFCLFVFLYLLWFPAKYKSWDVSFMVRWNLHRHWFRLLFRKPSIYWIWLTFLVDFSSHTIKNSSELRTANIYSIIQHINCNYHLSIIQAIYPRSHSTHTCWSSTIFSESSPCPHYLCFARYASFPSILRRIARWSRHRLSEASRLPILL